MLIAYFKNIINRLQVNRIMLKQLQYLILLFLGALVLSGCSGDTCIDADDFGFAKFTVSARYQDDQINKISGSSSLSGNADNQVGPWRDSGLTVNGRPLLMVVKTWEYGVEKNNAGQLSAWCPWFGDVTNESTLSKFCLRLSKCNFPGGMCTSTQDAIISNAPCLMKNGVGLYALIGEKGTDPNGTITSQRSPKGITMHLGEPVTGFTLYDFGQDGSTRIAGGVNYQYENDNTLKQQYANTKLYFKILDKFYDDNAGQYKVIVKSGVNNSRPDPLEYLTQLVKENLFGDDNSFGIIRLLYTGITENPSYKLVITVVLSLYIAYTALSFLTGNLNITQAELIVRIVKVIIISLLLRSEYSWNFFNNYLFVFFVDGMAQILSLIQEAAATGSGPASIIGLMIAPQTISKVLSLLFTDWLGFVYIILFIIALYFVFMMFLEATIIYLTALIIIGMIIVMGPIFLCFMLFQITRSLFENWLKQLISYSMQPLILFAGLAFISIIIRTEIYQSLGFRVCKYDFPDLGPLSSIFGSNSDGVDDSITHSIFYWWFPSPMKGSGFNRTQAIIPIPMDHFAADGITFCEAYGCTGNRYIELPYLDPVKDVDRLNKFFNGQFVQLDGLLLIFVCVYLLSKFNNIAVSVSKFLSGSSGNLTSLQAAGSASYAGAEGQINRPINAVGDAINRQKERVSYAAASAYEGYMMNSLRKDALKPDANKAVLDEVRRQYGLEANELKPNAIRAYELALERKIIDVDGKPMSSEELRAELAKDYSMLNAKYQSPELKELAADARFARDFQNAYANAHQAMSGRGVGLFGKNMKGLQFFQEANARTKDRKNLEKTKRRQIAEGLYAKILPGQRQYDYTDPALRTYPETFRDQKRAVNERELQAQIDRETIKVGQNILRPEYLVELEKSGNKAKFDLYKGLANEKIAYDVANALSRGEDPAIMGKKFMQKNATDTQLKESIDKANQARNNLINQDIHIRREDKYEVMQDRAVNNIKQAREELKAYHGQDISAQELIPLAERYYTVNSANGAEANAKIDALKNSMQEFEKASATLQKINERKMQIDREIDKHINQVNNIRAANKMPEYKSTTIERPNISQNLDDYLK